jgi:hypothetical protein
MPGVKVTVLRPGKEARAEKMSADVQKVVVVLDALPADVDFIASRTLKVAANLQAMHSGAYSRLLVQVCEQEPGWRRRGRGLERACPFKPEPVTGADF